MNPSVDGLNRASAATPLRKTGNTTSDMLGQPLAHHTEQESTSEFNEELEEKIEHDGMVALREQNAKAGKA